VNLTHVDWKWKRVADYGRKILPMTLADLERSLESCRLIASVQASEGSAVDDPKTLLKLALASSQVGVKVLRLQGIENIREIKVGTGLPVIGLIKRKYPESDVYITATLSEVQALLDLGCEIIALDGTSRQRPEGWDFASLVEKIHAAGALAMADCDTVDSARWASDCGADLIGTTLAGYTAESESMPGPDLELLRQIVGIGKPVIAEGRYNSKWQVEAALRIGAAAVVIGGALNDPVKQTRALMPQRTASGNIGAVDIGGTWLRFGVFGPDWRLQSSDRIANPPSRAERISWIKEQAARMGVDKLGVSSGGVIDPTTGICIQAKEYLMPDQIGLEFSEATLGISTQAHGDGHATAWAHACLPQWAGKRVAALALGTGVGCGFVQDGRIWSGRRGEYPRINDLPTSNGNTFEQVLGGLNLTTTPTTDQMDIAKRALEDAAFAIRNLYFPDVLVVGGSVGLSDWLQPELANLGIEASPFGTDAGLYGAAALALFPPS
jgi:N-acetylmannosamine-6-phosphate 2-epimerase/N-acetylmannosamine kinase